MATATATATDHNTEIVDMIQQVADELAADGYNAMTWKYQGKAIWKNNQTGPQTPKKRSWLPYMAEGLTITVDDGTIYVTTFVGNGLIDCQIKINHPKSAQQLAAIVRASLEA